MDAAPYVLNVKTKMYFPNAFFHLICHIKVQVKLCESAAVLKVAII